MAEVSILVYTNVLSILRLLIILLRLFGLSFKLEFIALQDVHFGVERLGGFLSLANFFFLFLFELQLNFLALLLLLFLYLFLLFELLLLFFLVKFEPEFGVCEHFVEIRKLGVSDTANLNVGLIYELLCLSTRLGWHQVGRLLLACTTRESESLQ